MDVLSTLALDPMDIYETLLIIIGIGGAGVICIQPFVSGTTFKRLSRDCERIGLLTLGLGVVDYIITATGDGSSFVSRCAIVVGMVETILSWILTFCDLRLKQKKIEGPNSSLHEPHL